MIGKVERYTKEKFACCGSTMVLGKWLPREHIGVRHVCRKSTMELGKRLSCEHIGVRCMVWQERPRQKNWTSGRQDAVWCRWGENFWMGVKRKSNLKNKCKSTQKFNSMESSKDKVVFTAFRITKWLHALMWRNDETKLCWILVILLMLIEWSSKIVLQVGKHNAVIFLINTKVCKFWS